MTTSESNTGKRYFWLIFEMIKIQNLFYIYCYAWRLAKEGRDVAAGIDADLPDAKFLSSMFLNATKVVIRRGMEMGYATFNEELSTVRGKISLGTTLTRDCLRRGRAFCQFDELSLDTPNNQALKATLNRMMHRHLLTSDKISLARRCAASMDKVSATVLSEALFARCLTHRNNNYYDLAILIAKLLFRQLSPEEGGSMHFKSPVDDETKMSTVFEEFVRAFYQAELTEASSAKREDIAWHVSEEQSPQSYLPKMQTDVTLRRKTRTTVIDAKFYKSIFSNRFDTDKLISANLYQMSSYLQNWHLTNLMKPRPDGILIYPSNTEDITLDYKLCGFQHRIATVCLNNHWENIHRRMLEIIE